jgi:hypothetical protein
VPVVAVTAGRLLGDACWGDTCWGTPAGRRLLGDACWGTPAGGRLLGTPAGGHLLGCPPVSVQSHWTHNWWRCLIRAAAGVLRSRSASSGLPTSRLQRGAMLWRSDNNLTYLMGAEGIGRMRRKPGTGGIWQGVASLLPGCLRSSGGLATSGRCATKFLRNLGWAVAPEKGFCAALQSFERGFAFVSAAVNSCTAENLYNHVFEPGWQPLLYAFGDSGRWRRGVGDGGSVPVPPTVFQTPTVEAPVEVPATTVPVGGAAIFAGELCGAAVDSRRRLTGSLATGRASGFC